jgi:hypothetical protein
LAAHVVGQRLLDVEGEHGRPVRDDLHERTEALLLLVHRQQVEQVRGRRHGEVFLAVVARGAQGHGVLVAGQRQPVVAPS